MSIDALNARLYASNMNNSAIAKPHVTFKIMYIAIVNAISVANTMFFVDIRHHHLGKIAVITTEISDKTITISQMTNGSIVGNSIKHQLNTDQLDIGSAFCWNARIAMIAIDNIVVGQEKHPKLNEYLPTSPIKISYGLRQKP